MTVKSLDELLKVPSGIVGTGRSFRMVLYSEYRELTVPKSFYSAIIEVKVCHLKFLRTWHVLSRSLYSKSVVLTGN